MNTREAERWLAMPAIYDDATVRHVYAHRVKANHPDHGGDGTLIAKLKEARDVLLSSGSASDAPPPCRLCGGIGRTKGRFGSATCTACGGTGDAP